MWITAEPPFGADSPGVVLAVGPGSPDPGEDMVRVLLNRGYEGEEGVFHLLPDDLRARYQCDGDRLAVVLVAYRQVLAADLAHTRDPLLDALGTLPPDPADEDRVVLLRREISTDWVPAEQDRYRQPVLVLDHEGDPGGPAELLARFQRGEAALAVLRAD
jgi:hypothetical protein